MPRVQVGDSAPNIDFTTHDGERVALSDFRDKRAVVLFFYPKDGTPICTKEACAFRDSFSEFQGVDAEIFGVSGDSAEKHAAFATQHKLPYRLVSDAKGEIRRAFGVPKTMGVLPGRVTYVIDRGGVVRHVFNSQLDSDRHVREALDALRSLDEKS